MARLNAVRSMTMVTANLLIGTPCNCLALRQAARHISQLYDQHLAEVGLRTTQYSILSKLGRLGAMRSWQGYVFKTAPPPAVAAIGNVRFTPESGH